LVRKACKCQERSRDAIKTDGLLDARTRIKTGGLLDARTRLLTGGVVRTFIPTDKPSTGLS